MCQASYRQQRLHVLVKRPLESLTLSPSPFSSTQYRSHTPEQARSRMPSPGRDVLAVPLAA